MQWYKLGYFLLLLAILLPQSLVLKAQHGSAALQYDINRAAVVMLRTEVLAEVNVQKININKRYFNQLLDSIQHLQLDSILLSPAEKLDIVLEEFRKRPQRYFISEFNYFRHREKVTARGSGFLVSGGGYVVTNCHVVDEGDAYINRRFILSAFNYVTESNINALEQEWAVKFTEQQRGQLYQTYANVYSRIVPIELEKVEKNIYVVMNGERAGDYNTTVELVAHIVRKGSSMPGKDVAILKINSRYELPALELAKSEDIAVGSDIYVYGYPNPVMNNEFLSAASALEPTLTKGVVSAWKKTINGWPVIQMDAGINHGNSGGPVCNAAGRVIGISTFGSLDDNARALAPGLNFAIPLQVFGSFFSDSIIPAPSQVQRRFRWAITDFKNGYYQAALDQFNEVAALNPHFPGILDYTDQAKLKLQEGSGKIKGSWPAYLLLAALGLLAAGIFWWQGVRTVSRPSKR